MAVCPKCYQDKPLLAPNCPHCTKKSSVGDNASATVVAGIAQVLVLVFVLALFFG